MPIHEFACEKCDAEFELLVRHDTIATCPECQGKKLTKLFSVPASPKSSAGSLPVYNGPQTAGGGGCGMPACRTGCQYE